MARIQYDAHEPPDGEGWPCIVEHMAGLLANVWT